MRIAIAPGRDAAVSICFPFSLSPIWRKLELRSGCRHVHLTAQFNAGLLGAALLQPSTAGRHSPSREHPHPELRGSFPGVRRAASAGSP
jgi:hypothetical protein